MSRTTAIFLVVALAGITSSLHAQTTLFADSFERGDNTDLNADTAGKSGSLGALNWVEVVNGGDPRIDSNEFRLGESGGGGAGWSIAYLDHNFTDTAISSSGDFTVSVDLVSAASNGGTRFTGFMVGNSLTEMMNWSSNNPPVSFTSDFFIGYDTTGTNEVKIFIEGDPLNGATEDYQQSIDLDSGGNLMVTFSSITDFNSGSTVNYEAFIDGGSVTTGSFVWSGTNENYMALYSNYTLDRGFLDNFEVSTTGSGGGGPTILDGDFNADNRVDLADYTQWRNNLGSMDLSLINNAGDDTDTIDIGDYEVWRFNYGATQPGVTAVAVPEPSAFALLGFCCALGLLYRRK